MEHFHQTLKLECQHARSTMNAELHESYIRFIWQLGSDLAHVLEGRSLDERNDMTECISLAFTRLAGPLFSVKTIAGAHNFSAAFPTMSIANVLGRFLSWEHLQLLSVVDDPSWRIPWAIRTMEEGWSADELSKEIIDNPGPLVHTSKPQRVRKGTDPERQLFKDISTVGLSRPSLLPLLFAPGNRELTEPLLVPGSDQVNRRADKEEITQPNDLEQMIALFEVNLETFRIEQHRILNDLFNRLSWLLGKHIFDQIRKDDFETQDMSADGATKYTKAIPGFFSEQELNDRLRYYRRVRNQNKQAVLSHLAPWPVLNDPEQLTILFDRFVKNDVDTDELNEETIFFFSTSHRRDQTITIRGGRPPFINVFENEDLMGFMQGPQDHDQPARH